MIFKLILRRLSRAGAQCGGHASIVSPRAPSDAISVSDPNLLFNGDSSRSGVDLITSRDDREPVLQDYFRSEKCAALSSPDGAHLTSNIVNAQTGHVEYAQAGGAPDAAKVIGHLQTTIGSGTLTRAGGIAVQAKVGDPVCQGDVIETAADGRVGLRFVDGTRFELSSSARMVLDEFVCDANGTSHSSLFGVTRGTFAFIVGQVAETDCLRIDTPVGSIRGRARTGGIGMLSLTALIFSVMKEVHAAEFSSQRSLLDTLDDDNIKPKDLQLNGTIELFTKDGRHYTLDDPQQTIVISGSGSVSAVTNSPTRMAELQRYQQEAVAAYALGINTGPGGGGSSTPPSLLLSPEGLQPINFDQPVPQNLRSATTQSASVLPTIILEAPAPSKPAVLTLAVITPMVGDSSVNTGHTLNASGASIGFAINGTTDGVENGQTVTVTIVNASGVAVDTFTTTVANNAWSVNVSPTNARALSDGNYTVTADVSNAAGTATARASQNVTVDETPPAPPGAALTIDSGSSNSDHITNVGALSLSGIESGATVEYSINGGATWTTSFTPVEGPNTVLVRQTDVAGNVSSATSFSFTLDTDKAEHVTLTAAAVINAAAASTAAFTIAGLDDAVTAGTLSVTDGTHTVSTAVTNNGTFHLDVSSLTDGTITASFTATDGAGNPESASITVTLDTDVISGKTSGSVEIADDGPGSGRLTDTGTLTDTDVDNTFIAVTTATNSTGGYGVFTMTAAGVWTYTLKNSPNLGEGQHLTDTFTVHTVEGTAQVITITIGDFDTAPAGVAGSAINLGLTQLTGVGSEAVTVTGAPLNWTMTGATHNPDGSWTALTNDFSNLTITPDVNFVGATVLHVTETWTNSDGSMGSTILSDNVEAYAPASPIFAVAGDDHLTGTGSGDQFVFAQPIGNDIIYNFDAASDKIDLIGFSNIASFADIQGNIADDASGNAVIKLGANETITINGVHAASVTASDFVFNQSPSTENRGTMQIGDGSHLPLSGTINNTGTIALNSTRDETDLQLIEQGVTLEGGGKILLSDSDANIISGTSSGVTLNNEDNTISGAGQLGNGELTLTNAGTIDATGTHALTIDTGSNLVTNSGVLVASGSGGMMVTSGIVNSGVLWANGATLTVQGAVSGNGTATIDGIGALDFEASTSANVVFGSGTGGTLKLGDSFHFNGTISGFGGSDVIDLANVAAANASISYHENTAGSGGTLAISNGAQTLELSLLGHYSADNFSIVPDQMHGTSIIYVPHDLML